MNRIDTIGGVLWIGNTNWLRHKAGDPLFPPVFLVVEDYAFVFLAVGLLQERYLIAQTELNVLCDMEVGLGICLKIEVVPYAALKSESDIVECLIRTGSVVLVEQRALSVAVQRMVIVIIVS